jgi:O-antigen ligase
LGTQEAFLFRAARLLTFASAAAVLFSIAASQILLALALAALLFSGAPLRLPANWKIIALFLLGTLLSLVFSQDPAGGLPQVRKIFVFTSILLIASTLREAVWVRRLYLLWAGIGALVAIRALVQFGAKVNEARALGRPFYDYYVVERITGFMSHWMTFGGQEMFALLMLAAFVFFAPGGHRLLCAVCGAFMGAAIVLGFTRSIWIATFAGGLYLLWFRKRALVAAVPVLLAVAWFAAPGMVRARFTSLFRPGKVDSNQHRVVSWRTGWEMIKARPLTGLGPEEVKRRFDEFVPADVPRPLPTGWYGHLHNIYLHYAAERGLVVLVILLWLFAAGLWDFTRGLRALPPGPSDERFLLHGGIAILIATMIEGLFEHNLGDSEVLTMFLIVITTAYTALERPQAAAHAA